MPKKKNATSNDLTDPDSELSTTAVLELFARWDLTRDILYFWEKRGWIDVGRDTKGKLGRRRYSPEEVKKISILARCYWLGLTTDAAYQVLQKRRDLKGPRLRKLLEGTKLLARNGILGDLDAPHESARKIAVIAQSVMDCEVATLLLPHPTKPDTYRIGAQVGTTPHADAEWLFRVHDEPGAGLTGHVIHGGKLATFSGRELREHPASARTNPVHVPSGRCVSLLMAPVLDRRGRNVAWIKLENRLGQGLDQRPGDWDFFDPSDEAIAEILAEWIGIVLEGLRLLGASRDLLDYASSKPTHKAYMSKLLRHSLELLAADRGDVFWFNQERRELVLEAVGGASDDTLIPGDVLPAPGGIVQWVFQNEQPRIVGNVDDERGLYVECCKRTKSELAVPLMMGGHAGGVLNVESFTTDHFDQNDIGALRHLAAHAVPPSTAIAEAEKELHSVLQQILRVMKTLQDRNLAIEWLFRVTLEGVVQSSAFKRARAFRYDEPKQRFVCIDSEGIEASGNYLGKPVDTSSPYAKETIAEWKAGRLMACVRQPDKMFGPDPNANALGKAPNLPWAIAPIVVGFKFFGYLAADNAPDGKISDEAPSLLMVFAVLAAQALASRSPSAWETLAKG